MASFLFVILLFSLCLQEIQPQSFIDQVAIVNEKMNAVQPFNCPGNNFSYPCKQHLIDYQPNLEAYFKGSNNTGLQLVMARIGADCTFYIPDNLTVTLVSEVCMEPNTDGSWRVKFRYRIDNFIYHCNYGTGPASTGLLKLTEYITTNVNSTVQKNLDNMACANEPQIVNNTNAIQELLVGCITENALNSLGVLNFTGVVQYMFSNVILEIMYVLPQDQSQNWTIAYSTMANINDIEIFNRRCEGSNFFKAVGRCMLADNETITADIEMFNSMLSCTANGALVSQCPQF